MKSSQQRSFKILHVIGTANPTSGGPLEGIFQQNAHPKAIGSVRELVTMDAPDAPFLSEFPMTVHAMGPAPGPQAWFNPLYRMRFMPKMISWLKENVHRYDVVFVHGLWNFSPFAASLVLPSAKVPYFVFTHGMMDPWFRRTYPLKHVVKQILWLFFEGRLLQHASGVLFTSEEERRLARSTFMGRSDYPEVVVNYGTSPPPPKTQAMENAFAALAPKLRGRKYLLFLSRIHEKKGCDLLVEAFAAHADKMPDTDLVIAGPDQSGLRAQLLAIAQAKGVEERIHWPGMLQGDAKWGAYYGADAFILPSHQENFGIVVAEALACSLPVLTTNKVNIWREIVSGGCGFIEDDTFEGTLALLRTWTKQTPSQKAELSRRALSSFKENFHIDAAVSSLNKHIKQVSRSL